MKPVIHILKDSTRNNWYQHGLFWVLSMYVLARIFAYSDTLSSVDWIYTFLFHLSLIAVVYLNIRWLIPDYLRKNRYILYLIFSLCVIFLGIGIHLITFDYLADLLFPGYYFIGYYGFWEILEFMLVYFVISSLLKFSKSWFEQIRTAHEMEQLAKEKLDAELTALKSQINPHFLFNCLNNLYSLSLDLDHRTPDLILQLSYMMRYLLYETNVSKVSLDQEIAHLENYIDLQKLGIGESSTIRFDIQGKTTDRMIAPLLFLPLVENGFKHGIKGDTEGAFIHIFLEIKADELIFKVENNKDDSEKKEGRSSEGVGLKNLRRRLELLYPDQHQLQVIDGIRTFMVVLKINLI